MSVATATTPCRLPVAAPAARGAMIAQGVLRDRALITAAAHPQAERAPWADPHRPQVMGSAWCVQDLEAGDLITPMRRWIGDWTWDGRSEDWFHPDPVGSLGRLMAQHSHQILTSAGDGTRWGRSYAVDLQAEACARTYQLPERHEVACHLPHCRLFDLIEDIEEIVTSTAYPDQSSPHAWAKNRHWFDHATRADIDLAAGDPGCWCPTPPDIFLGQRHGRHSLIVRVGADELAVRRWHPQGQVAEEFTTWCTTFHGLRRTWYADGKPRAEETWLRGLRHGPATNHGREGHMQVRSAWACGRLHGAIEIRHGSGDLETGDYQGGYRIGTWTTTNPEGRIVARGPYDAGLRHGDWIVNGTHIHYRGGKVAQRQLSFWDDEPVVL